jgi:UDP-hydrolysing UDP-N-acetyl-D-glucosamine 2-epimerase
MKRICVVVHSRANYGRIKSVMRAIDAHPELELVLLVGSSALLDRFGSVINIMHADGFKEAAVVHSILEGETPTTMAKSTGLAIIELATHFENVKPDVVLTVADRFETLATAVAASYMNIPLAHTQGGEVTGSIDESVRHAITKLAHIHFPATARAKDFVLRMGEPEETVHLTGCPAMDLLAENDMTLTPDLFERYAGVGGKISTDKEYIIVLQHPVTTEYGDGLAQINETL